MSYPRVWFITGSSTGFGRLLTEIALKNGEKVVATLRRPEVLSDLASQYGLDKLLIVKVDVTNREDISTAFAKAKEIFGRIDVVFNNAGYGILAEVEGTTEDEARKMFEVLFWGAAAVSKEAIKFFRDVNKPAGGKLLQMSSMYGTDACPGIGYYSSAKFAVEGLTEALSKELDPKWNIKVIILCPGWYRTPVTDNAVQLPALPPYQDPSLASFLVREAFKGMLTGDQPALGDPEKLLQQIYALSNLPEAPFRIPLGLDALALFKQKNDILKADTEKSECWSKDLHFD